jgi:hypothetical protein
MGNEEKRKLEGQEISIEDPEIDQMVDKLVEFYFASIMESGINQLSIKLLFQRIVVEASAAFFVASNEVVVADGFTVIYDELEVGVGRHVYYLRSQAEDEATALAEFRDQFFSDANDEQWAWLRPVMRVHAGRFLPEYVKVFSSQPKALVIHWPDTPY